MADNSLAEMGIGVINALLSVLWVPAVIAGMDPFGMLGGTEVQVMAVTILGIVAVFDIVAKAGIVCYPEV